MAFIARPNDLLEISIRRVQRILESHLSDSRLVHRASQLIFCHSNQAPGFRMLFFEPAITIQLKPLERIAIKAQDFFECETEAGLALWGMNLYQWMWRCSRGEPVELN